MKNNYNLEINKLTRDHKKDQATRLSIFREKDFLEKKN